MDQPTETDYELKGATLNSHGRCLKVVDTFRTAVAELVGGDIATNASGIREHSFSAWVWESG